jgi:hypothetical protein
MLKERRRTVFGRLYDFAILPDFLAFRARPRTYYARVRQSPCRGRFSDDFTL